MHSLHLRTFSKKSPLPVVDVLVHNRQIPKSTPNSLKWLDGQDANWVGSQQKIVFTTIWALPSYSS